MNPEEASSVARPSAAADQANKTTMPSTPLNQFGQSNMVAFQAAIEMVKSVWPKKEALSNEIMVSETISIVPITKLTIFGNHSLRAVSLHNIHRRKLTRNKN